MKVVVRLPTRKVHHMRHAAQKGARFSESRQFRKSSLTLSTTETTGTSQGHNHYLLFRPPFPADTQATVPWLNLRGKSCKNTKRREEHPTVTLITDSHYRVSRQSTQECPKILQRQPGRSLTVSWANTVARSNRRSDRPVVRIRC